MTEISFGEWLKRQRKGAGLTQEQLAGQIGCSTITLRKIEAEERRPSAQIVERLAEIFNLPHNERTAFLRYARGDWQGAPNVERAASPWHASSAAPRSNLPVSLTSLVGRDQEIGLVRKYLLDEKIRLVTLTGPPGIGKTRLSLESARASLNEFEDGVFFVALAALDDASLIATTVLQALGFVEKQNLPGGRQLIDGIRDKHMLIVLDNCEHLVQEAAAFASEILSACPNLKIISTSRESLCIPGEWLYAVPALDLPDESSAMTAETIGMFPALALFAERAQAVRPDFVLNAQNIRSVASICAQLDGLPLAIELVAARMRLMSAEALLARLNDASDLSANGTRSVPERQKSLTNAISWSYQYLHSDERRLFVYLAVFSGGFTLSAAETIFSQNFTDISVSGLLTSLLDKSFLQRLPDSRGEPRLGMLVTIQQFALDRLRETGNEAEARNWHLAYFLNLTQQAEQEIHGARQVEWLDRLESEQNNYRAALDWCISSQASEPALHIIAFFSGIGRLWSVRSYFSEARSWFDRVRALPELARYPLNMRARSMAWHSSPGFSPTFLPGSAWPKKVSAFVNR